jgi:hypothetical protein
MVQNQLSYALKYGEQFMEMPRFLKGESLTRLVQGAAFGAISVSVIGFGWAGWTLAGTAEKLAEERATKAIVTAYAPVCVERYIANATEQQRTKFKEQSSWSRDAVIENTGFATPPGSKSPNRDVADACAEALTKSLGY